MRPGCRSSALWTITTTPDSQGLLSSSLICHGTRAGRLPLLNFFEKNMTMAAFSLSLEAEKCQPFGLRSVRQFVEQRCREQEKRGEPATSSSSVTTDQCDNATSRDD